MNIIFAVAAVLLAAIPGAYDATVAPDLCSIEDCPLPPPPDAVKTVDEPDLMPYDYDVDADVFTLYAQAGDLCATMRAGLADGEDVDDMLDAAVDVLTEQGVVTTTEGGYYLRGMLVGCIS